MTQIANRRHRRAARLSVALVILILVPCGCNEERPLGSKHDQNASHTGKAAVDPNDLLIAVSNSQSEKVAALLSMGADPNVVDAHGQTPLYITAHTGDVRSARLLIAAGANIAGNTKNGTPSPLYEAAGSGNMEVAQFLISKAAKVNARHMVYGDTPLHRAAEEGHLDMVKFLLKNGAAVNARNHVGQTALHRAAMWGNQEVLRVLLDKGADPGLKDNSGALAWQIASDKGHVAATRLLQGR